MFRILITNCPSTKLPPSISPYHSCSGLRYLRGLQRSVEESREKCMLQRGLAQVRQRSVWQRHYTVILETCVNCEYHVRVTTLEDCRHRSNFCPTEVQTLAAEEPLHRKQRSWPLDHQWCLMLPWSGQGFPPQHPYFFVKVTFVFRILITNCHRL